MTSKDCVSWWPLSIIFGGIPLVVVFGVVLAEEIRKQLRERFETLKTQESRVLLYHTTRPEKVSSIRREGIKASEQFLVPDPRRKRGVFAWTLKTLKKWGPYFNTEVIVFRARPENWLCGDLAWEYFAPEYQKNLRPLETILEKPWLEDAYIRMECFYPDGYVPPENIVAVRSGEEFKRLF